MNPKIYVYSNILNYSFLKNLIDGFDVYKFSTKLVNDQNFKNNNVFFITDESFTKTLLQDFLIRNNVFILLDKKEDSFRDKDYPYTSFLYSHLHIKNIKKLIKNNFDNNQNYQDLKLNEEKIINQNTKQSCYLTSLEKKIFLELISKQSISREYFLENILKVSKRLETKTVESHLTRIRKKLQEINSIIKISSKSDQFFIEN